MKNILFIALAIFCVCGIIIYKKIDKKEQHEIISNRCYTIGTVYFYSSLKDGLYVPPMINSPSNPAGVKFSYIVNNKLYNNQYNSDYYKMPLSGIVEGEKYLVIYKKNEPEKSLMLFNYPIKNDTDLKKYLEIFKKSPLNMK